ncbi:hypothetical protein HRI_004677800 [Hibiscus trionum]|uniref:Uncharacterized protein n=1 Tax=Hibiscus trionum TaxID=183268 RepID=A0A9W7J7G5_HIBTR|nr:hypothetical protein HRI_004677800 [Hibiscus trionum]
MKTDGFHSEVTYVSPISNQVAQPKVTGPLPNSSSIENEVIEEAVENTGASGDAHVAAPDSEVEGAVAQADTGSAQGDTGGADKHGVEFSGDEGDDIDEHGVDFSGGEGDDTDEHGVDLSGNGSEEVVEQDFVPDIDIEPVLHSEINEEHDEGIHVSCDEEVHEEHGSASGLKAQNTHSMTTRSKAGIFKPKLYHVECHEEPSNVYEALEHPQWREAVLAEYRALLENNT